MRALFSNSSPGLRRGWLVALLGLCALAAGPLVAVPPQQPQPLLDSPTVETPPAPKFAENHLLVRFRPGVPPSWQAATHAGVKTRVLRRFRHVRGLQLVELPKAMSVEEALRAYRRDPNVLYAEPDYVVHADLKPNDTSFGQLWALHNRGQNGGTRDADIDAKEAWDLATGSSSVVVGVIDTGIDYTHPDLAGNMLQLEGSGNCSDGLDNDGNGFADDCFGIDTVSNFGLGDNDPMDDVDHGTHVAGTIGAVGNNSQGVVGVNWQVGLVACKFLDLLGGVTSGAIACLDYLADLKQNRGVNLVATNNSWGGGGFSQALLDAIDAHRQLGILFIAAAGNSATDNDVDPHFPSSYYLPNVIAVAATDRNDARSGFSSFGRFSVHLGAPGSSIVSTTPGNTYSNFSGTSMATPHVTGVAALLKAHDPGRDWIDIKNLLLAGGDSQSSMNGVTVTGKRLNAFGAMTCANSVVESRLRPVADSITAAVGGSVALAALNINCAAPNGNVDVVVDPGNTTVTLLDDGAGTDQEAGDGIYSGEWTPAAPGTHTLTFPGGDVVTVNVLSGYSSAGATFSYRALNKRKMKNLNLDDDSVGIIISPFPIQFGGGSFSTLRVSANGVITFDNALPFHSFNEPLPTPLFNTLVAPFWDDLFPVLGSKKNVFWQKLGTAPNRELVIEWKNVRHFGQTPSGECSSERTAKVRFQVVFFENSSDILFNYLDTTFGDPCSFADQGSSATVGLQTAPGVANQIGTNTPSVADNTAILWQLIP